MKRKILALVLIVGMLFTALAPSLAGTAAAAAPSHVQTQSHTHHNAALFDKTRFLLHMGLAYYAFHHFVYARYKAKDFNKGAAHRTKDLIEAGIALLFAYHEVKVAYGIAKGSNSATLHALIKPVQALGNAANSVAGKFKKGDFSTTDFSGLTGKFSGLAKTAGAAGYTIHDLPVKIPGL
jgi:hypothetical protein